MDARELARRAYIARRLKAGRWLVGGVERAEARQEGKTHKVGYTVAEVSQADFAKREPLPANGFTASKIGSIERMERHTSPMELSALTAALGIGDDWFDFSPAASDLELAERLLRAATQVARETRQGQGGGAEGEREQDLRDEGLGGDDA